MYTILTALMWFSPVILFCVLLVWEHLTTEPTDYHYVEEKPQKQEQQPLPKGTNVIEMRDAEALAYISKHPAMQFHRTAS